MYPPWLLTQGLPPPQDPSRDTVDKTMALGYTKGAFASHLRCKTDNRKGSESSPAHCSSPSSHQLDVANASSLVDREDGKTRVHMKSKNIKSRYHRHDGCLCSFYLSKKPTEAVKLTPVIAL